MIRDFITYNVKGAYAYNSPFDDKVFTFNSDWYKCNNPFDNLPIFDIRGYVHAFLLDNDFFDFCDKNGYYTDTGNYSTTAETVYRYITGNTGFIEDHTALSDSEIEAEILFKCLEHGAELNKNYPVLRSIKREVEKTLTLYDTNGAPHKFDYHTIRINKEKTEIKLK